MSELLSKPRVWHKLTDKGREAFRRIYGWLCDDVAIELLCTMSPRRVAMPCDKIEHPPKESYYEDYNNSGTEIIELNKQQTPPPTTNDYLHCNDDVLAGAVEEEGKDYLKSIIDLQVNYLL